MKKMGKEKKLRIGPARIKCIFMIWMYGAIG
jgi:hypothetical protein